jgi:hypothetical protein
MVGEGFTVGVCVGAATSGGWVGTLSPGTQPVIRMAMREIWKKQIKNLDLVH